MLSRMDQKGLDSCNHAFEYEIDFLDKGLDTKEFLGVCAVGIFRCSFR